MELFLHFNMNSAAKASIFVTPIEHACMLNLLFRGKFPLKTISMSLAEICLWAPSEVGCHYTTSPDQL